MSRLDRFHADFSLHILLNRSHQLRPQAITPRSKQSQLKNFTVMSLLQIQQIEYVKYITEKGVPPEDTEHFHRLDY